VQAHDVSVDGLTVAGSRDGIVLVGTGLPTQVERTVVRDPARFGISVQNGAAELVGNRLQGGPTGIRLRDATGTVRGNEIRGATHYGVSVAGRSAGSAVEANTLSGRGPAAVDTFRLAPHADVVVLGNDVTSWTEDQDDWVYWSNSCPGTRCWSCGSWSCSCRCWRPGGRGATVRRSGRRPTATTCVA
jgi:hypothetical protein